MRLHVTIKTADENGYGTSESWVYDLETIEELNEVSEKIIRQKQLLREQGWKEVTAEMDWE